MPEPISSKNSLTSSQTIQAQNNNTKIVRTAYDVYERVDEYGVSLFSGEKVKPYK